MLWAENEGETGAGDGGEGVKEETAQECEEVGAGAG